MHRRLILAPLVALVAVSAISTATTTATAAATAGPVEVLMEDVAVGPYYSARHYGSEIALRLRLREWRQLDGDGSTVRWLRASQEPTGFKITGDASDRCRFAREPGKRRSPVAAGGSNAQVDCALVDGAVITVFGADERDAVAVDDRAGFALRNGMDVHLDDGDDEVTGGAGDDELNGHDGDDILRGGAGDDQLFGVEFPGPGSGGDVPTSDDDYLYGESGRDVIYGGFYSDMIVGGLGADRNLCASEPVDEFTDPLECVESFEDFQSQIYSSEHRERDLDTGAPLSFPAEPDRVDCGWGPGNRVQYDTGIDELHNCPSRDRPEQFPPQLSGPGPDGRYPIPSEVRPLLLEPAGP